MSKMSPYFYSLGMLLSGQADEDDTESPNLAEPDEPVKGDANTGAPRITACPQRAHHRHAPFRGTSS